MQVLLWRDVRVFRNTARGVTREPLRLLGWLVWFGYIAYRLTIRAGAHVDAGGASPAAMDISGAILLFVTSLSLLHGEQPPVPFFASASEARWLANARLRPWITALYLQLRNALARFPSMMLFLAYIITVCPPPRQPPAFVLGLTTLIAMLLLTRLFAMPREFAPRPWQYLMIGTGSITALAAAISALQAFLAVAPFTIPFVDRLPAVHAGELLIWGISGDPRVGCAVYSLVVIALFAGSKIAQNRYPELYELSVAGWEARRRFREGRYALREQPDTVVRRKLRGVPSGAAAQLWINWIMYRRAQAAWWICVRPLFAFGLGFACIATHNTFIDVLRAFGVLIVLITMMSSAVDARRIGKELRRTIYWLTDADFFSRLAMIIFSWYWRSAGDIALFTLGTLIAGTAPSIAAQFLGVALCGVWLQRCITAAAFAILPNKTDLGGPTYLVHIILLLVFTIPPVVAAVAMTYFREPVPLIAGCSAVIALLESAALLAFAAKRLRGRFDLVVGY